VECQNEPLAKQVFNAFDEYFFLKSNSSNNPPDHINLEFTNNTNSLITPSNARELFNSPQLRVLKNGKGCYLEGENASFQLDLADCRGTGYLDQAFWDDPAKTQQEILTLSLLWLFHKHGLFSVHGNALVKDGKGVFLIGDSCSGKSTTALSLVQKGWSYLSDDVNLLKKSSRGVKALAFQKGFSFDPRLENHYPEFKKSLIKSSWNGKKRFIDIRTVHPEKFQSQCIPKVIIFPQVTSRDKSRLIPVSKTTALILLMQNSGGVLVDKEMAKPQVEILKTLNYQTSSYQLLAGRDLYEEPEKISEVLSDAEIS
jgi:hypothetical protein